MRAASLLLGAASRAVSRFGMRLSPAPAPPTGIFVPDPSCQVVGLGDLYALVFGDRRDGLVVEVGAHDGVTASNSSCLVDAGWRALLVEPVAEFAAACRARYAGRGDVEVVETAVGASEGEVELLVAGTLTTAHAPTADAYDHIQWARSSLDGATRRTVPMTTLDDLLERHRVPAGFDVLVVDVEGFEAEVFEGADLDRWRPRMVIVELTDTHPDLQATRGANHRLLRHVQGHGYQIIYKDQINTVFVRTEDLDAIFGITADRA